ncbi:uncharacterized protein LOC115223539 isoform X1, partial [Argonauta hians]
RGNDLVVTIDSKNLKANEFSFVYEKIICQMNVYANIFSSESKSKAEYVMLLLAFWNKFHCDLKKKQSRCLNKLKWGEPVLCGKHALTTLDRKQRGGKNILDSEENVLSVDEECKPKESVIPEKEGASLSSAPLNVNLAEECGKSQSPIFKKLLSTELKINPSSSYNIDVDKSNVEDKCKTFESKKITRLSVKKLGNKKQVDKENVLNNVRPNLLQRRRLFRNREKVSETVPTNWTNIKYYPKDTPNTEPLCSKLDQDTLPNVSGNNNGITYEANKLDSKEFCLRSRIKEPTIKNIPGSESSSLSPLKLLESPQSELKIFEKLNGAEENNPSDEEIPSSSPIFSSKISPRYKDDLIANLEEEFEAWPAKASSDRKNSLRTRLKNSVASEITDKCETNNVYGILPCVAEGNKDNESLTSLPKRKRAVQDRSLKANKKLKLPQKKSTVQCPVCSDWFKQKVIEKHAASCGVLNKLTSASDDVPHQLSSDEKPNSKPMLVCDANEKMLNENNFTTSVISGNPPCSGTTTTTAAAANSQRVAVGNKLNQNQIEGTNNSVIAALDTSRENNGELETGQPASLTLSNSIDHQKALHSLSNCLSQDLAKGLSLISTTHSSSTKAITIEASRSDTEDLTLNLNTKEKHCYICDATFGDDGLFSRHQKSCLGKYKKLQQQFENKYSNKKSHRITRKKSIVNCTNPGSDAENKQEA